MAHAGETVIDDVALRLVAPDDLGLVLRATLRYEPSDPLAVEATFRAADESISWVLGRDLLSAGLVAEVGEGDVRVWPAGWGSHDAVAPDEDGGPALVMIELSSPDGRATLAVGADDLQAFLARTFEVVPQGAEADYLDLDAVLAQLLR